MLEAEEGVHPVNAIFRLIKTLNIVYYMKRGARGSVVVKALCTGSRPDEVN
jgi:hypothetical protein